MKSKQYINELIEKKDQTQTEIYDIIDFITDSGDWQRLKKLLKIMVVYKNE